MTTEIDGLQQFSEWYSTLSPTTIDQLLAPVEALIDAALAELHSLSTFPSLPVDNGVGVGYDAHCQTQQGDRYE